MKKKVSLFAFVALISLLLLGINTTRAFTIEPSSGDFAPGVVETFDIVASPDGDYSEVYIRIKTTGAIVNYVDSEDTNMIVLGACNAEGAKLQNGASDQEFEVCVNVSKLSGDFEQGDDLGKLTLQSIDDDGNAVTIESQDGNGYALNGETDPVEGILASYAFGDVEVAPIALPDTAISDYFPLSGLVGVAFFGSFITAPFGVKQKTFS